jgi:hypothetical protein
LIEGSVGGSGAEQTTTLQGVAHHKPNRWKVGIMTSRPIEHLRKRSTSRKGPLRSRSIAAGLLALVSAGAITFTTSTPAQADTTSIAGYHQVVLDLGRKCLEIDDVGQPSLAGWPGVYEWWCDGMSHQLWRFDDLYNGTFLIRNIRDNKCLDLPWSRTGEGQLLVAAQCTGTINQQWSVRDVGNGSYEIASRSSAKCLSIEWQWWPFYTGLWARQQTCNGWGNQHWFLVPPR